MNQKTHLMTYSNTDARLPAKVVFSETFLAAIRQSGGARRISPSSRAPQRPTPTPPRRP